MAEPVGQGANAALLHHETLYCPIPRRLIAPGFLWRTWRYEPGIRRCPLIPRKATQLVCRGPLNKGGANVGETRWQVPEL
eukprot:scaffold123081_cov54-Phaeocystis_antarctica.AAC.1